MPEEKIKTINTLVERLNTERKVAFEFQKRRHDNWNDNYELYRNKVKINRLTQRQAVNIPIMKETLKTLQSRIDDPPDLTFEELSGNKDKEMILNERWNYDADRLNFEGIDIQDKKTVLLYGRGFKKLNFFDKKFKLDALDIYDVIVDPKVNPLDLETARWLIHQNIFRPLKDILADERYTKKGKDELKILLNTDEGQVQAQKSKEALEEKQKRLKEMGVKSPEEFAGSDVIVNLSEHYTYKWEKKEEKFVRYVVVVANEATILLEEKLIDLLGVEFYPFVTWGDDIESQDFWSDGPGDIVRVPNKILNVWFSQLTENRTLKNFNMSWFNALIPNYSPPTIEPGPGKLIPAPGNPKEAIMPMDVKDLKETIPEIEFLIGLIEKATAATNLEKGMSERKQITLGEVQILAGKSAERITSIAKFYRRAWKELAWKWYKIIEANVADNETVKLFKTSSDGNLWPKEVKGKDWKSKAGYRVRVSSSSEQEEERIGALQKLMMVKAQSPNNLVLAEIILKRSLEITNLTPDEIRQVSEAEKRVRLPEGMGVPEEREEAESLLKEVRGLRGVVPT